MCESFNAILECDLLVKHRFKTQRDAALAVFAFIEGFYNPRRRHTSIGNISPMEFERRSQAARRLTKNSPRKRASFRKSEPKMRHIPSRTVCDKMNSGSPTKHMYGALSCIE